MYYLILSFSILIVGCAKQPKSIQQIQKETISSQSIDHKEVQVGLDVLLSERLDLIQGKSIGLVTNHSCLLYTSPSPRDKRQSRMPSSA